MSDSGQPYSEYRHPVLVGGGISFTILPIIFVGLRFYARRVAHVVAGMDDWCILVALVRFWERSSSLIFFHS